MIVDSALGTALEKVDIVLSGAENVVENGGIVNKVFYSDCKSPPIGRIASYSISLLNYN